jgi:hypothetical protein
MKKMTLTEYISQSISNIEKRIDRAKNKTISDKVDFNILRRIDVSLLDADINEDDILSFLGKYKIDKNTKLQCSEIKDDMEYEVQSEQHDYYHSSTWITDIVHNFYYSYYEVKTKDEIDYLMIITEAINIAKIKKDEDYLNILCDFVNLIRHKKIPNNNVKKRDSK